MKELDAFNPITRRALRIHYVSPLICMLATPSSASASGGAVVASLDIEAVVRKPGPTALALNGTVLSWDSRPYIFAYVVYFATAEAGPFQMLTSNVQEQHFDVSVLPEGNYFFKVTGLEEDAGETLPSPTLGPVEI